MRDRASATAVGKPITASLPRRSRAAPRWSLWGWLVVLALSVGCEGEKVTEIFLSVGTDLNIPLELEAVQLQIAFTGGDAGLAGPPVVDYQWDVDPARPGAEPMPLTLGLLPGDDPHRPIVITLRSRSSKGEVVRQARLPFAKERIILLQMNLLQSCLYREDPCPEGQTCVEGGACAPIDVDPDDLPDYDPRLARRGLEAGPAPQDSAPSDGPLQAQDTLDLSRADVTRPDTAGPDAGLDSAVADLAVADLAVADLAVDLAAPDAPSPDVLPPDVLLPDVLPPDLAPVDSALPDLSPDAGPSCVHPEVTASCQGGWCTIPAGCFMMGSSPAELCADTDDEDYHAVTLSHAFELEQTEVTQQQFASTMGYNQACHSADPAPACPSTSPPTKDQCSQPGCPVEWVTWHEAAAYCNALSQAAGFTPCFTCTGTGPSVSCQPAAAFQGASYYDCPGYRLPTDAEWEYATRAGTQTEIYSGPLQQCTGPDAAADLIAWYLESSSYMPHPTGGLQANAWGLHDTSGNVWEWVYDGYFGHLGVTAVTDPLVTTGTKRVRRGGSFAALAQWIRSANRGFREADQPGWDLGFRCARTLP